MPCARLVKGGRTEKEKKKEKREWKGNLGKQPHKGTDLAGDQPPVTYPPNIFHPLSLSLSLFPGPFPSFCRLRESLLRYLFILDSVWFVYQA